MAHRNSLERRGITLPADRHTTADPGCEWMRVIAGTPARFCHGIRRNLLVLEKAHSLLVDVNKSFQAFVERTIGI